MILVAAPASDRQLLDVLEVLPPLARRCGVSELGSTRAASIEPRAQWPHHRDGRRGVPGGSGVDHPTDCSAVCQVKPDGMRSAKPCALHRRDGRRGVPGGSGVDHPTDCSAACQVKPDGMRSAKLCALHRRDGRRGVPGGSGVDHPTDCSAACQVKPDGMRSAKPCALHRAVRAAAAGKRLSSPAVVALSPPLFSPAIALDGLEEGKIQTHQRFKRTLLFY